MALTALLLLAGCTGTQHQGAEPGRSAAAVSQGTYAPDFTAPAINGTTVHLAGLRGHPVLLVFLDTRATPGTPEGQASRAQVTVARSLAEQYGPRGLSVLLADPRPTSHGDLVNFSYDWGLGSRTTVLDPADPKGLARDFGVTATPTVLLAAPDGRIAQRSDGRAVPAQDVALPLQHMLRTASPAP